MANLDSLIIFLEGWGCEIYFFIRNLHDWEVDVMEALQLK